MKELLLITLKNYHERKRQIVKQYFSVHGVDAIMLPENVQLLKLTSVNDILGKYDY